MKIVHYDGMEAIIKAASAPDAHPDLDRASRDRSESQSTFCGTDSFDEAVSLARRGWTPPQFTETYDAAIEIVNRHVPDAAFGHAQEGVEVDVGALLGGAPEAMLQVRAGDGQSRTAHIIKNIGASAAVSPDEIIKEGAAVAALVDALEARGVSVRLDAASCIKQGLLIVVELKHWGEALDLPKVCFALAHPSMLRRIEFGAYESMSREDVMRFGAYSGGGYGRPCEVPAEFIPEGAAVTEPLLKYASFEDWLHAMLALVLEAGQ